MHRLHDPGGRLEKLRVIESAKAELSAAINHIEKCWMASDQTVADRRDAGVGVVTAILLFARQVGLSEFGTSSANDIAIALGELTSGRKSALLSPAKRPSNTLSATDLAHQGVAHASVTLLRKAGLGAEEARAEVARQFKAAGIARFGIAKLRALGSGLTGLGSEKHPAYSYYCIAIVGILERPGIRLVNDQLHPDDVRRAIKEAVRGMKTSDHRDRA